MTSQTDSARRAYEAGIKAKSEGKPLTSHSGWGYALGRYYWWFGQGYLGREFEPPFKPHPSEAKYDKMRAAEPVSIDDIYAEGKARKLIAEEFMRAGQTGHARQYETGGFTTAPLRAMARYIASRE